MSDLLCSFKMCKAISICLTGNDPMKHTTLITKALFTSTQGLKIGSSPWYDIAIQSKFNTANRFSVGSDVKVDSVGNGCRGWCGGEEVGEEVHLEGCW